MNKIMDSLSNLAEQIAKAKQDMAVLQGRKEEGLKRLREEYKLDSIEGAETFISNAEGELNTAETSIREDFKKLQETFEW